MINSEDRNKNGDATMDSIVIRPFKQGDPEKIMQVDWSNKVENCYVWRDGKLFLV